MQNYGAGDRKYHLMRGADSRQENEQKGDDVNSSWCHDSLFCFKMGERAAYKVIKKQNKQRYMMY